MKQFKKRTIALVLASVVTVVGAFGAENYKNSLMSLKFESSGSGAVNMTLLTKRDYTNTLTPIKKDANTYVLMLPETNSQMDSNPELGGDVESVDVRTMPYTNNSKGYTKITIKTAPNTLLSAKKALYIPEKKTEQEQAPHTQTPPPAAPPVETPPINTVQPMPIKTAEVPPVVSPSIHSGTGVDQTNPVDIKSSVKQFQPSRPAVPETVQSEEQPQAQVSNESNTTEVVLLLMGVFLIIVASVYFYISAKNKLAEVLGEQPELDLNDDKPAKPKEKPKKIKQIKKTIKTLDKMYTQPPKMPVDMITTAEEEIQPQPEEKSVVVDLDELFQEKTKAEENLDEDDALADFLSAFSFIDEPEETESGFNEELYNKYINDDSLKFSKDDIERIEKLLNSEINDETLKNISEYAVSNPVEKKPSRTEILENFVTAYTINQNITFTQDDVDALYKLMSVEIDSDFITDLRTDPNRIREMEKEIERQKSKPHKTSELLTLNVKDMLPDLSEALKKQGGKRIESEVKPQVVYYSEGYEVNTLSIADSLPDLSKELDNEEAYKSRPSDEIEYAVSGYDVQKMSISQEFADVLKNPDKYDTPKPERVEIDEDALLRNISNVTFKPFYDGTEEFEVVNEFDEENAPSVSDMQEEFNQFGDLEIVNQEEADIPHSEENDNDDFAALYDNNYVDLDAAKSERRKDEDTDKLLRLIEEKQEARRAAPKPEPVKEEPKAVVETVQTQTSCIVEGEEFTILNTTNFTDKIGCYLARNDKGYGIIGFVGDKVFKIKNYEKLKTEKIQSRVSEKLADGSVRYIVRIGIHKFILNVSEDNMEYVMDLC